MSSLGEARTRAKDAAGKAAISQVRTTMELYFLDNNTYESASNNCDDASAKLTLSLIKNGATNIECNASATEYAYIATLPGGDGFCADSTGYAGINSPQSQTPTFCESGQQGGGQQ